VGGIRAAARLARLVAAGLPRAGVVLDGALAPLEQARRLTLATRSGLPVEVEGAAWVWPQRLDGVQPGDEVLVYADLPAARPLRVTVGGRTVTAEGALAAAPRPLLERAWVKARLARLMAQRDTLGAKDPDLGEALRKQVIDLSIKHRVLSPYTALLVLETEQDYRRFGIERRALADILTVGPGGIAVLERRDFVTPVPAVVRPEPMTINGLSQAEEESSAASRPERAEAQKAEAEGQRPEYSIGRGDKLDDIIDGNALRRVPSPPGAANAAPAPPASPRPPATARAVASAPAPTQAIAPVPVMAPPPSPPREAARSAPRPFVVEAKQPSVSPYEGPFEEVMALLRRGQRKEALALAFARYESAPGDVLALVALGEAAEAAGELTLAARAYGSIVDLFPGRADLRRFAGNRLERLRGAEALALAIDTYRAAVEQRPDHPASHRLLAFALVKAGRHAEAFAAIAAGVAYPYPGGRFAGVPRILGEDLGLIAAAWMRAQPARAGEIRDRLARAGGRLETGPSLRFVLTWETDANDVDFHIHDGRGGHAFYSQRMLASGRPRLSLPPAGPLLQPRPDGLRHGQAADRRARRARRPALRGAPVRGDAGQRLRRDGGGQRSARRRRRDHAFGGRGDRARQALVASHHFGD
jgi:hypothetical protein